MLQSINWCLFDTTKKLTLNFSFRRWKKSNFRRSKREFSTLEKPRRKISQFLVSRGYIFKVEDLSFWWEDVKRGRGPTCLVGYTILGFLGRHQKIAYCAHTRARTPEQGRVDFFSMDFHKNLVVLKKILLSLGKTNVSWFFFMETARGVGPQGPQVKAQDTGGPRPFWSPCGWGALSTVYQLAQVVLFYLFVYQILETCETSKMFFSETAVLVLKTFRAFEKQYLRKAFVKFYMSLLIFCGSKETRLCLKIEKIRKIYPRPKRGMGGVNT